jgi:hypothetical protein
MSRQPSGDSFPARGKAHPRARRNHLAAPARQDAASPGAGWCSGCSVPSSVRRIPPRLGCRPGRVRHRQDRRIRPAHAGPPGLRAWYYISEIPQQQPEMARFIDASVPDELTAGACAAVSGRKDAAALLRGLDAANPFRMRCHAGGDGCLAGSSAAAEAAGTVGTLMAGSAGLARFVPARWYCLVIEAAPPAGGYPWVRR